MAWSLEGEYFENCSCDILCPCITSSMAGPADTERCQVPLIMHIERGEKDGVQLDGLNAILLVDSPQVMGEGGWRLRADWWIAATMRAAATPSSPVTGGGWSWATARAKARTLSSAWPTG